jgi:hypothetical protein
MAREPLLYPPWFDLSSFQSAVPQDLRGREASDAIENVLKPCESMLRMDCPEWRSSSVPFAKGREFLLVRRSHGWSITASIVAITLNSRRHKMACGQTSRSR